MPVLVCDSILYNPGLPEMESISVKSIIGLKFRQKYENYYSVFTFYDFVSLLQLICSYWLLAAGYWPFCAISQWPEASGFFLSLPHTSLYG
jgi:hypothetical protein